MVWSGIFYARQSSDGTWSSPQNISIFRGSAPQLAVDGAGTVHVVWWGGGVVSLDTFYAKRSSDGTWLSPQNISNTSGDSFIPQLAVDERGAVHVVWPDRTPGFYDIFYARRSGDGTWSSLQKISNNSDTSESPQLAIDRSGTVHVVWSDSTPGNWEIFYARRSSDGAWSAPEDISNTPDSSWTPQLAVDESGAVHVVWDDLITGWTPDILYAKRSSDGTWSSAQNISNNAGSSEWPQLAVDGNRAAHVVWGDTPPATWLSTTPAPIVPRRPGVPA